MQGALTAQMQLVCTRFVAVLVHMLKFLEHGRCFRSQNICFPSETSSLNWESKTERRLGIVRMHFYIAEMFRPAQNVAAIADHVMTLKVMSPFTHWHLHAHQCHHSFDSISKYCD